MRSLLVAALLVLIWTSPVTARATGSVLSGIAVEDVAWDDGTALQIHWQTKLDEDFRVLIVREGTDGLMDTLGLFPANVEWVVDDDVTPAGTYRYRLSVFDSEGILVFTAASHGLASPHANWFHRGRLGEALIILGVFAMILWGTFRRRDIYLRPIGGLSAIEEALGRAVEMGRPVLFSAGWGAQLDKPTTMAAMNIFGWLASRAASYDARLLFPTHDAVIMAAAQESARESARIEGRPDWYRPEDIYYVTGSQFGYAAALDGIMERQKPAVNLWLGTFAAESLILAETGNHIGAVQIAGTDSTIQLAFFLVTCDYTLIGEEVFAASAYLTRDPMVLGGLWAQDWLKIGVAVTVIAGLVGTLLGWDAIGGWLRGI